jgi:predicted transposase/invertase (TIGR01784 family)
MFATKLEAYRKQLKDEGREEGLEQGREKTRRETAARLLRRGDSLEEVAEITGLSVDTVRQIRDAKQ